MENKYTTNYNSSRSSVTEEKSGLLYHAKKAVAVGATGLALTLSGCGAMNAPTVNGVPVYQNNKTEQASNGKHESWVERHPVATIFLGAAAAGLVYSVAHGGGSGSTSQAHSPASKEKHDSTSSGPLSWGN